MEKEVKKMGRPPLANTQAVQVTEEGDFLLIKVPKKLAAKLLLKDLFN